MSISLEDAINILLENIPKSKTVRLPLEKCYKRVMAEEIISDIDFPPFRRSPLDGYAVRLDDISKVTAVNPVLLTQVDYVPAGAIPVKAIGTGETARIMTGAQIPEGADAVVRQEDVVVENQRVRITSSYSADKNICNKGEELSAGDVVLTKGTYLQEGALGMLAMLGQSRPRVFQKPKVGILATGSELTPIAAPLMPGKIRDSNSIMLDAKVRMAGGVPVQMGQVEDDIEAIIKKLYSKPNLSVYITTGGASVGDYDLAEMLFNRLKVPVLFNRVTIKPGMPVLAGIWNGALLIALSGNPAACSVSFEVLVRPLIRKMAGFKQWEHTRVMAKLSGSFEKISPARRFAWARCFAVNGILYAMPLQFQGNGMLRSILGANALLDIPANSPPLKQGTEIEVLLMQPWL